MKPFRINAGYVEDGARLNLYGSYMRVVEPRKDQCIYIWTLKAIQVDTLANAKEKNSNSSTKEWYHLAN